MKTILTVVWLLSSGQFQGEPFQTYDSAEVCEAVANTEKELPREGRFLFLIGCLDETENQRFIGIRINLFNGLGGVPIERAPPP